jgi:phosphoglycolate phosphatase
LKRALIFDLDGTLVDSLPGIADSLNRALKAEGLPGHPVEAVRSFIGNGARALVQRACSIQQSDAALVSRLELAFKADYELTWISGTIPYAGIATVLESSRLLGLKLAVLSNKPDPFTRAIVDQLFPQAGFSYVLGHREDLGLKPDPAGALEILKILRVSPDDCAIIGDSTMDILTARRAGSWAIGVGWGYHDRHALEAAGADHFCCEMLELSAAIKRFALAADTRSEPPGSWMPPLT